jgi:hypothetical protein
MLSPRTIYDEIFSNDEAFCLFCSIAASGEAQGGWENGRIAALVPESFRDLAPKIARHGADEDKHGRIFNAVYLYERLGGWHRMVTLRMPSHRDPLGTPASARACHGM